ncbi:MAG: Lin0512 family protein [Rhodospirillales bacterium]
MALQSLVIEFGVGTDIRGGDYTKAAKRAVDNAIRRNSVSVADAFGKPREEMRITVAIGVAKPEQVDKAAVAAMLPYGEVEVEVMAGGLDIPHDSRAEITVMANATVTVFLDLPDRVV